MGIKSPDAQEKNYFFILNYFHGNWQKGGGKGDIIIIKKDPGFLPPANEVWGKVIFLQVCVILFTGGGGYPRMPCRSHDQPALYKQLHCWWVSVGEEAADR